MDLVFAGVGEARLLVPGETPQALAERLSDGTRDVVVTLGDAGCHAYVDGAAYSRAAAGVAVADPVGAGDAFVAGYLAELIADQPPAVRLATATAVAGLAVATPGDWEGLPRREELPLLLPDDDVLR